MPRLKFLLFSDCSYSVTGMYVEAEKILQEAIKLFPDNHLFYNSLGVLVGRLHKWEVSYRLVLVEFLV